MVAGRHRLPGLLLGRGRRLERRSEPRAGRRAEGVQRCGLHIGRRRRGPVHDTHCDPCRPYRRDGFRTDRYRNLPVRVSNRRLPASPAATVQFVNNDLMTPAAAATSPRRRGVLAALSTAAVLAVGACSGATGAFGGDFSVQDLLGELPMIDDGGLIVAGDLEAASAAAGLERPADAGADGAHDWGMGLPGCTQPE